MSKNFLFFALLFTTLNLATAQESIWRGNELPRPYVIGEPQSANPGSPSFVPAWKPMEARVQPFPNLQPSFFTVPSMPGFHSTNGESSPVGVGGIPTGVIGSPIEMTMSPPMLHLDEKAGSLQLATFLFENAGRCGLRNYESFANQLEFLMPGAKEAMTYKDQSGKARSVGDINSTLATPTYNEREYSRLKSPETNLNMLRTQSATLLEATLVHEEPQSILKQKLSARDYLDGRFRLEKTAAGFEFTSDSSPEESIGILMDGPLARELKANETQLDQLATITQQAADLNNFIQKKKSRADIVAKLEKLFDSQNNPETKRKVLELFNIQIVDDHNLGRCRMPTGGLVMPQGLGTTYPSNLPMKSYDVRPATWIKGKSGFVKSPYTGKEVDVRGFPPGTHVNDKEFGNTFVVPDYSEVK